MADFGFIAKNSSGGVQIDSTYKNFTVQANSRESFSTISAPSQFIVDFTDISDTPVFAFKPILETYLAAWRWVKSGSEYSGVEMLAQKDKSGAFDWVIFTEEPANAMPDFGLVVKNAAGDVVFSSDERYFKIESVTSLSFDYTSYQDVTGIDADNNYFILVPHLPWIETATIYWPGIKKISSSSLRVKHFSSGTGTGPYLDGTYTGTLIEVSF